MHLGTHAIDAIFERRGNTWRPVGEFLIKTFNKLVDIGCREFLSVASLTASGAAAVVSLRAAVGTALRVSGGSQRV